MGSPIRHASKARCVVVALVVGGLLAVSVLSIATVTATEGTGSATVASADRAHSDLRSHASQPASSVAESSAAVAEPSADWWHSPRSPQVGETVTFVVHEREDSGVTYRWDLDDDGDTDREGGIVTYTFEEAGEHTVTLEATADDGGFASESKTIEVEPRDGGGGESAFTHTPLDPHPDETVTFVADDRGANVTYRWDVDDDGSYEYEGRIASHAFEQAGDHTVTLEVSEADGTEPETESRTVSVQERSEDADTTDGEPTVWHTPADPDPGETVTLVVVPGGSVDDVDTVEWDLNGDEAVDHRGRIVSYTVESEATTSISVSVQRTDGTTETLAITVPGEEIESKIVTTEADDGSETTSDEDADNGTESDDGDVGAGDDGTANETEETAGNETADSDEASDDGTVSEDGDDIDDPDLDGTPGFGTTVAVVAILLALGYRGRRRSDT